ncbi:MAG: prepilin-type N-terminal cleavage/methylation domain-containing protein [Candidatus Cloacimonetes bacterium]|nr:prepilin-type N-terminal cleavage/methylation domain-containing protein [Candidatus Cloacimonadota bacterium]
MNLIKNNKGFSLSELLIVIVVIGILLTLAVPKYLSVTRKAKETEAKLMLNQVYALQESYYYEYDIYSNELLEIGFEQQKLITDGGKARYLIEIEKADEFVFIATATSIVDFDKDGTYNIWEVNQEGKIKIRIPD